MRGNANGLEDAGGGPGKSYLFLLTAVYQAPESVYPEMGRKRWESTRAFRVSGAPPTVRENSSTGFVFAPPGVLITASGLQGV